MKCAPFSFFAFSPTGGSEIHGSRFPFIGGRSRSSVAVTATREGLGIITGGARRSIEPATSRFVRSGVLVRRDIAVSTAREGGRAVSSRRSTHIILIFQGANAIRRFGGGRLRWGPRFPKSFLSIRPCSRARRGNGREGRRLQFGLSRGVTTGKNKTSGLIEEGR